MGKFVHIGSLALVLASLGACSTASSNTSVQSASGASTAAVSIDLRMRDTPDDPYRSINEVTVPTRHVIGDGMFPYEGIGWENGFVGYRLYLDGRLTSDVFGKRQTAVALDKVSAAGKYHELAPWGMDVLHVGPSLGMGGLGIVRDGQPRQFGKIASIKAKIDQSGPDRGVFTIHANGIEGPNGATGGITSRYAISQDSPLTRVSVKSTGGLPLTSGLVSKPGIDFWQSNSSRKGAWAYIATFGPQSENKDNLGIALFYRKDQASYGGFANETHFVAFNRSAFDYGFMAAWELDASGIKTRAGFERALERELARLDASK